MRLTSILLLLALLPRVALGTLVGELLCIGSDHVSYDCHQGGSHGEAEIAPLADETGCIDFAASRIDAKTSRSDQHVAELALAASPVELIHVTPLVRRSDVGRIESADPPFDAGGFCRSITPRC